MPNLLYPMDLTKWRAKGFMILSAACWGGSTVMSKAALEYIPPLHLLIIQLAASITLLWMTTLIVNQRLFLNWAAIKYSLTGFLEPGLAYIFGMLGLVLTTATKASLLGTTEPIIVVIISWLFLREKITRSLLYSAGLAFTGVILIIGLDAEIINYNNSALVGDILIFIGTFCAALYVIFSHRIVGNFSPVTLAAVQQTAGFILVTFVWYTGILGDEVLDFSSLDLGIWFLAIFSGIVQYALAFWFYLIALKTITVSSAALFLNLIPVFGVGAAYLFLNEKLTILQWLGAIIVLIAVANISMIQRQREVQVNTPDSFETEMEEKPPTV
ncbi:DMT family transporter [Synechococcus sp. PCC 7336]|uniref:DMT family transporter n=1 Tax=Synechococcus sp. PCC 7336 TaxID=195250 RepID=UPI00034AEB4B|nr:DMT family transporter [Synechococcus sp. PCC 7336]